MRGFADPAATISEFAGSGRFLHGSRPRSLINAELAERSRNQLEPFVIDKFTGIWAGLL
jgi:hypothetical protein